jgi:hypothetical protein
MAMKKKTVTSRSKAKAKPAQKKKAPKAMSQEAMMALWQVAMTPSAGHTRLEPLVGTWNSKTTFTMGPGAPAQVYEGTSEHRFVLGGRYLEQVYKGMAMGMPLEGIGYTGYDNATKRHVGSWMDTFGTCIMTSVGVGRPTESTMRFLAESHRPSGRKIEFDAILRVADRNRHSYEMWTEGPGGKRFRSMIVEYVRAG